MTRSIVAEWRQRYNTSKSLKWTLSLFSSWQLMFAIATRTTISIFRAKTIWLRYILKMRRAIIFLRYMWGMTVLSNILFHFIEYSLLVFSLHLGIVAVLFPLFRSCCCCGCCCSFHLRPFPRCHFSSAAESPAKRAPSFFSNMSLQPAAALIYSRLVSLPFC